MVAQADHKCGYCRSVAELCGYKLLDLLIFKFKLNIDHDRLRKTKDLQHDLYLERAPVATRMLYLDGGSTLFVVSTCLISMATHGTSECY